MARETNTDGLIVNYGARDVALPNWTTYGNGPFKTLVVDFSYAALPAFDQDAGGGTTEDSFSGIPAFIPAGCKITRAWLDVGTAFASGTSYNIGLYQRGGTVIDADGIDAAVATAALAAGYMIACDGALVGAQSANTTLANDAYVVVAATGTFTAGTAKLVIEYIEASD